MDILRYIILPWRTEIIKQEQYEKITNELDNIDVKFLNLNDCEKNLQLFLKFYAMIKYFQIENFSDYSFEINSHLYINSIGYKLYDSYLYNYLYQEDQNIRNQVKQNPNYISKFRHSSRGDISIRAVNRRTTYIKKFSIRQLL